MINFSHAFVQFNVTQVFGCTCTLSLGTWRFWDRGLHLQTPERWISYHIGACPGTWVWWSSVPRSNGSPGLGPSCGGTPRLRRSGQRWCQWYPHTGASSWALGAHFGRWSRWCRHKSLVPLGATDRQIVPGGICTCGHKCHRIFLEWQEPGRDVGEASHLM